MVYFRVKKKAAGNSDGCGLSYWVKSFKCDLHFRFWILPNVTFVTVTFFSFLFNYLSLVIINSGLTQSYCKSLFLEKLPLTCHVYHSRKRKLGNEHIDKIVMTASRPVGQTPTKSDAL